MVGRESEFIHVANQIEKVKKVKYLKPSAGNLELERLKLKAKFFM